MLHPDASANNRNSALSFSKILLFFTTFLLSSSFAVHAQDMLNLNFERTDPVNGQLSHWYTDPAATGSEGFKIGLDSLVKRQGRYSLRIEKESLSPTSSHTGNCINHFLVNFHGKKVRLSGFIKTEGITDHSADLFLLITDDNGTTRLKRITGQGVTGTTSWTAYSQEMPLDSNAYDMAIITTQMAEHGKAWFDSLSLFVDEVPYNKVVKFTPWAVAPFTPGQMRWLKINCIPVKSVNPGSSLSGLMPFTQVVGDARIVGLGEFTHSSHEIFSMKHKLIKLLVEKMHFTLLAMETNMGNTFGINQYILTGKGDPRSLIKNLYPQQNTREVLHLIEWLRDYNKTAKDKVRFFGIDIQRIDDVLSHLRSFAVRYDERLLTALNAIHASGDSAFYKLRDKEPFGIQARRVSNYLNDSINLNKLSISRKEQSLLKQCAAILLQAYGYLAHHYSNAYRDSCMTANIAWMLQQYPGARMVLWSHNLHIGNRNRFMGSLLKKKYGDDYLSVGSLGNSGRYIAFKRLPDGKRKLAIGGLSANFPGSYEYRFHLSGLGDFILDLRRASSADPDSRWLFNKMKTRENVGSMIMDNYYEQYRMNSLTKLYDVILYLDKTTPSEAFGLNKIY